MALSPWGISQYEKGQTMIRKLDGSVWKYLVYAPRYNRTNIYQGSSLWGYVVYREGRSLVYTADGSFWGSVSFDSGLNVSFVYKADGSPVAEFYFEGGLTRISAQPILSIDPDCVLYHAYWNGDAKDHSRYGNDGVLVGTPLPAFVANGLQLSAGAGQYVDVPFNDSLTPLTGAPFTFEMVLQYAGDPQALAASLPFLYHGSADGNYKAAYIYASALNKGSPVANTEVFGIVDYDWALNQGVWAYVAVTFDPAYVNGDVQFYHNASKDNDVGGVSGIFREYGADTLWIGADVSGGYFDGVIGEVRLWNRPLLPTEILANFNFIKPRYPLSA